MKKKSKSSENSIIGVRVDESLRSDLEELAKNDDRKLSDFIRVILKKYIEQSKTKK